MAAAGFWPGPGWAPWDALVAAGVRVVADPRSVAPPCVLVEVTQARPGAAGPCPVIEGEATAHIVLPGPAHGDGLHWAWTQVVPVLLPYAELAVPGPDLGDWPTIAVTIPFTHAQEA
jgi:hypothetical protein